MIYTEMYGRLGNQFFRYAATRALQIKYYPHDELVFSFDQIDEAGKVDPSFYNVLEDFNVCNYNVYPKKGKKGKGLSPCPERKAAKTVPKPILPKTTHPRSRRNRRPLCL